MIQINNAIATDFDSIDIDPFWNIGNETEHKNHRIHAYPAKFPAFITQKAITYAKDQGIDVKSVADIFCGCGTVAFEAKRLGIDFWGCDLNPTAVLIAKAKSNSYCISTVKKYYKQILETFDTSKVTYIAPASINERISYWFSEKEIRELSLLKQCIFDVVPRNSKYIYYFLCAFSNILKATSKWLTKSIKPQIDPDKTPSNVRDAFINQCMYMERAINEDFSSTSKTTIKMQNALTIKDQQIADLIITSPPYVTSYEYADLHQLSTIWLDYAEDYRELRKDSVGSNFNVISTNHLDDLNESGRSIVNSLDQVDKSKAKSVAKYFYDMQKITDICKRVLSLQGMVLMVIGNTEYKGVRIDNVKHLVESMHNSGFDKVFVTKRKITGKILTPYRNEKGRFSSNDNDRQVYAEEFIVVGRK